MKIDLNARSLKELKQLQEDVAAAIAGFEEKKKREDITELEAKAKEMGYSSLAELIGTGRTKRSKRRPAPPKYCHPENKTLQWSGRGRRPAWFRDALDAGVSEKDMLMD
jgi:DNA-binding protein H-NS